MDKKLENAINNIRMVLLNGCITLNGQPLTGMTLIQLANDIALIENKLKEKDTGTINKENKVKEK